MLRVRPFVNEPEITPSSPIENWLSVPIAEPSWKTAARLLWLSVSAEMASVPLSKFMLIVSGSTAPLARVMEKARFVDPTNRPLASKVTTPLPRNRSNESVSLDSAAHSHVEPWLGVVDWRTNERSTVSGVPSVSKTTMLVRTDSPSAGAVFVMTNGWLMGVPSGVPA